MKRISKYKGKKLPRYSDGGTNQVDPKNPGSTDIVTPSQEPMDVYMTNLGVLKSEQERVNRVRNNIVPTAQTIDNNLNPQTLLRGAPTEGNFCNAYTGECYNRAGLTTAQDFLLNGRTVKAGSSMPMIPGNLQQESVLNQEGFVQVPLSEVQPGDNIKKQYYSKGLPWQGSVNSNAQPHWISGHSMIYKGPGANNTQEVYNSPGDRNTFEKRTFKSKDWVGNINNPKEQDSRLIAYRYVGNIPELEKQTLEARKTSLDNSKPLQSININYNNKPQELQLKTPNFKALFAEQRQNINNSKMSAKKKAEMLLSIDQREKEQLGMYQSNEQPTTINQTIQSNQYKYGGYNTSSINNNIISKKNKPCCDEKGNLKKKRGLPYTQFAIGGEVDTDPDGSETKANPLLIQAFQQSLANQKINEQKAIDAKNQEIKNNPLGIKTLTTQRDNTNVVPIRQQTTLSKIQVDKKRNEADKLLKQQKKTQGTLRETPKEINPNEAWRLAASNYQGHDKEEMNRIINSSKTVEGLGALAGVTGGGLHALASIPAVANTLGLGFAAHGVYSLPSTYRTLVDPNESVYNKTRALTYNTADFLGMKQAAEALKGVGTAGKWAYNSAARSVATSKESGLLSRAHELNPFAFKPNPEAYYRGIGEAGYKDAIESGVLRVNQNPEWINALTGKKPDVSTSSPYFFRGDNFNGVQKYNSNIIAEVTGQNMKSRNFSNLINTLSDTPIPSVYQPVKQVGTLGKSKIPIVDKITGVPVGENTKFLQKDWLQGYKYKEVPKQLPGSPNVDFSKYLTQEEAVAARAERLISQKNKPGWNEQLTPELEQRLSNAVKNHNPASDYAGESLGANTMGRTATEVSRHPMNADKLNPNSRTYDPNAVPIYLNDANKARIAAHETGHYYSNNPAEGEEWLKSFNLNSLENYKTRTYLRGKGRSANYANEIRERAAQLKDYIAQKNNIPLNQDFKITQAQLDDAIENYVKDTGLDNTMSKMLGALKDKKGLLKTMNKYALGTVPAVVGVTDALQQKKYGGMINYMAKKTWAMGGMNMEQEIDPKPATSSTKTFNNIVPLVDAKTGKPNWDNYYSTLNKMGTNIESTNPEAKQTPAQNAINHYIGQDIVPIIKKSQIPLNIGLANKYGKAYNPTTGPTTNQFLDSTEGAAALGSPEAYQDFLNNTKAYNAYRGKTKITGTNTTGTSDPNAEMYGARYYNMFTPGYTAPLPQQALGGQFAMGGMTMKQGIIHAPEMGGYFRKK